MANRYWVGGTGNWDATTTTNWSATSGGAGGASVPTSADAVIFDSSSGTGTVTVTATANCASLTHSATNITLNTNGQTVTCAGAVAWNNGNLTLGASIFNCGGNWINGASIGTLSAGTSSIRFSGANANFNSQGKTWYEVQFNGSGTSTYQQGGTVTKLYRNGTASVSDGLSIQNSTTVTIAAGGVLSLVGNSISNRLLVNSTAVGTAGTISAPSGATVTLTNVDFMDVTCTGGATFSGTSVGNALGNSGITFTTPVTRYAVAAGNWSSTATWSATSGGAGGASAPICHDTVFLNASSAAGTYSADVPRLGANIDCTGFTGTLSSIITVEVYGSLTLASSMTGGTTPFFRMCARSSVTLTTAGKSLGALYISAPGGTVTLQGDLSVAGTSGVTHTYGTLNAGAYSVNAAYYISNGPSSSILDMGSGTWTLSGNGTAWSVSSGTVNAQTANIVLSNTTTAARSFYGGGKTYNKLTIGGTTGTSTLTIFNNNTFSEIASTKTVAHTILFTAGTTQQIGKWSVTGTSGNVVTIGSTSTSAATLNYTGAGKVSVDYMSISYSTATPSSTWYAGNNSVNGGNNSGWTFTAPPTGNSLFFGSNF